MRTADMSQRARETEKKQHIILSCGRTSRTPAINLEPIEPFAIATSGLGTGAGSMRTDTISTGDLGWPERLGPFFLPPHKVGAPSGTIAAYLAGRIGAKAEKIRNKVTHPHFLSPLFDFEPSSAGL